MKTLVTGGACSIGSHVVDRPLKEGYVVIAADNLSERHLEDLAHPKGEKSFRFARAGVRRCIELSVIV